MAAADILRDGARGAGRLMPLLLPGFAGLLGVASHGHTPVELPETFGGFLTLLLLLPFTAAVVGVLIQALRVVIFDRIVVSWLKQGVNEDSNDAATYAMYANFSIVWGLFFLGSLFRRWEYWWENLGRVAYLLILLWVWGGLIDMAMRAYHRSHRFATSSAVPAARKRKTTRKKPE